MKILCNCSATGSGIVIAVVEKSRISHGTNRLDPEPTFMKKAEKAE
jgi:hypothetical protein